MAGWRCPICQWTCSETWTKCAKCGILKSDTTLFTQLREEIEAIQSDIDKYKISKVQKWEYLQLTTDQLEDCGGLERLGVLGWEMVAASSYSEGGGMVVNGVGGASYKVKMFYVLKKPLIELPNDLSDNLKEKFQRAIDRAPQYLKGKLNPLQI